MLLSLALNGGGAASCDGKKGNDNVRNVNQNINQTGNVNANVSTPPGDGGAAQGNLKVLAEGQYGQVKGAFVAVARDTETYAALRGLIKELPDESADFFKSNAVVAAFLGERRSGGFGVRFSQARDGRLRVEETKPPPDAMTTQAITMPYRAVAVPLGPQATLQLDLDEAWQTAALRSFKVSSGEWTMTGGIAGRMEKFGIAGDINIMREGRLATLLLNLSSANAAKARALKDAASGVLQSDGSLVIGRLGAGTFVDPPADALRANGRLADNTLSLSFESIPGTIADGYNGRGNLEAAAKR